MAYRETTHENPTYINIGEEPPKGPPVDYARKLWENWCRRSAVANTPDTSWPGLTEDAIAQTQRLTALKAAYDESNAEITRLDKAIEQARNQRSEVVRQAVAEKLPIPDDETETLKEAFRRAQNEAHARRQAMLTESLASFDTYRESTLPVSDAASTIVAELVAEAHTTLDSLADALATMETPLSTLAWATSGPSPSPKPSRHLADAHSQLEALRAAIDRLGQ